MTFNQVTTTLATMRRMFEYKELKNLISIKLKKEEFSSFYKPSKLQIN